MSNTHKYSEKNLEQLKNEMQKGNIKSIEELIKLCKEDSNSNTSDDVKVIRDFIDRLDDLVDEFSKSIGFKSIKKTTYWYFRNTNEKDFVNNKCQIKK